jgi:hypothetical protein
MSTDDYQNEMYVHSNLLRIIDVHHQNQPNTIIHKLLHHHRLDGMTVLYVPNHAEIMSRS